MPRASLEEPITSPGCSKGRGSANPGFYRKEEGGERPDTPFQQAGYPKGTAQAGGAALPRAEALPAGGL